MTSDLIPPNDPHRPRSLDECADDAQHWHVCGLCRQLWPCAGDPCRMDSLADCDLCLLDKLDVDDTMELYAELGGESGGA